MDTSLTSDPHAAYLLAVGAPALECLRVDEADPTAGPLVAYVVDWTIPLGERVLGELPWTYGKYPRVITDEYRTVVGWACGTRSRAFFGASIRQRRARSRPCRGATRRAGRS